MAFAVQYLWTVHGKGERVSNPKQDNIRADIARVIASDELDIEMMVRVMADPESLAMALGAAIAEAQRWRRIAQQPATSTN